MELTVILGMIGLFITVLIQTVTLIWFFAKLSFRVDSLEKESDASKDGKMPDRLIKIETLLEVVQRQQDEQMIKIDKIADTQAQMAPILAMLRNVNRGDQ